MAISTACTDSPLIATGEQGRGRAHSRKSAAAAAELRRQGAGSAANALVGTVSVQRQYPRGHQAVCTNRIATRRRLLRGFAVADAYHHASQTGCVPATPLFPPRITTA